MNSEMMWLSALRMGTLGSIVAPVMYTATTFINDARHGTDNTPQRCEQPVMGLGVVLGGKRHVLVRHDA